MSPHTHSAPIAFVAMPFKPDLKPIYEKIIAPVLKLYRFEPIRGDEIYKSGDVIDQVVETIQKAELVVCDLTGSNPNVFYELGIAHALGRKTILISQNVVELPFDVKKLRAIPYDYDSRLGLIDLMEEFKKYLGEMFPEITPNEAAKHTLSRSTAIDFYRQTLGDPESHVRFKQFALHALAEYEDKESYAEIELIAKFDTNGDKKYRPEANPDLLRSAFSALVRLDSDAAKKVLIVNGLRTQAHESVREHVVGLLGDYPPDAELMVQMLCQSTDDYWQVRRAVCDVLGNWGKRLARRRLGKMMAEDPVDKVRLAASDAFYHLKNAEAEAELESQVEENVNVETGKYISTSVAHKPLTSPKPLTPMTRSPFGASEKHE